MGFAGKSGRARECFRQSSPFATLTGSIFLVTALWAWAQGNVLASNLLTNPGFESGGFNTGSNWVLAGELQIWDCGEAHTGACSLASSINPAGGPAVTFQFIDTLPGQEYDFSFLYKRNRNALLATVPGSYEIISGSVGSFSTVLEGSVTGLTSWEPVAGRFVAAGPLTRVSFRGEGFGANALNIDDVVLTAVPEPRSWAMLLAGLAALCCIARRKALR